MAAALAAIFELPIDQVPDFWNHTATSRSQSERVRRWLAGRGYHHYYSDFGGSDCPRLKAFVSAKREPGCTFPPRGYWIAVISSVDRLRDHDPNHVVVMRDRQPVFNPGGTVKEALDGPWFLIGYYLLVPLDPAVKT